jgi:hypothetical protein
MTSTIVSHQTVRLRRGKHASPEKGVCVMELASMLAGEPFSDRPACACPLTAALLRAERHGAPLGPALHALATDARARHAQRLRERAARAAPKIQLVVALLLVPAVMLMVGAALATALS